MQAVFKQRKSKVIEWKTIKASERRRLQRELIDVIDLDLYGRGMRPPRDL